MGLKLEQLARTLTRSRTVKIGPKPEEGQPDERVTAELRMVSAGEIKILTSRQLQEPTLTGRPGKTYDPKSPTDMRLYEEERGNWRAAKRCAILGIALDVELEELTAIELGERFPGRSWAKDSTAGIAGVWARPGRRRGLSGSRSRSSPRWPMTRSCS